MNQEQPTAAAVETVLQAAWNIPVWLTIVIAILAGCFAALIYLSERGRASVPVRWALASVRLTLLMLVLWMLAGWSWQRFRSDPAELVFVIDRSASMATRDLASESPGSGTSRFENALELVQQIETGKHDELLKRFRVQAYALAETLEPIPFSDGVDPKTFALDGMSGTAASPDGIESPGQTVAPLIADGTQSRLGDGLLRLIERQAGRGTAAIVFASDGINTSGAALSEAAKGARRAAIPIFAVALGRQFELPDVRLADLLFDREVYLGDQVSVEVAVIVSDIPPTQTRLILRDATTDKVLDETQVSLMPQQRQAIHRLSFVPDRPGDIALSIEAEPITGETELGNNTLSATVSVQDKTIRVLLVAETPSYEFRFLKSFLQRAMQVGQSGATSFELDAVLQDADASYVEQDDAAIRLVPSNPEKIAAYDVFVFDSVEPQLISQSSQEAIYKAVTQEGAGCIFIFDDDTQLRRLASWPLSKLLPVELSNSRSAALSSDLTAGALQTGMLSWQPTSLGSTALPMQLAPTVQESLNVWQRLPRFSAYCQIGQVKSGAQVLASALDRDSRKSAPLLIAQFAGAGRTSLQATDETYRWTSFAGSDVYFQRYWGQMLRWLSRGKLDGAADRIELMAEPKQAKFGQPVRIQVTLGGEDKTARNNNSVEVSISGGNQALAPLKLSRVNQTSSVYQTLATNLPPGSYRAKLLKPATQTPPSDYFTVTAPPGEQASLRANVDGMQQLAERSRGRFYTAEDSEQLFSELPAGNPTRLGPLPAIPIWNAWWVAALFITLITSEWILRRKFQML